MIEPELALRLTNNKLTHSWHWCLKGKRPRISGKAKFCSIAQTGKTFPMVFPINYFAQNGKPVKNEVILSFLIGSISKSNSISGRSKNNLRRKKNISRKKIRRFQKINFSQISRKAFFRKKFLVLFEPESTNLLIRFSAGEALGFLLSLK